MATTVPRVDLDEQLVTKPQLNTKVLKIYAFGQLFLIALLVLNVLFNWVNYCYWRLGLILGNCYLSKIDAPYYQEEYTLGNIRSDVCDRQSYRTNIESICPDFCSNLDTAERAGIACFVITIVVIVLNAGLAYLHFQAVSQKKLFKRWFVILLFLPFLLCVVQVIMYPLVANTPGAESVEDANAPAHIMKPQDMTLAGGYGIAIFIMVCQLASGISSFYPHRKGYFQAPTVALAE